MGGMIGHVDTKHNDIGGKVTSQVFKVPLEVSLASKPGEEMQQIFDGPEGKGPGPELGWVWHRGRRQDLKHWCVSLELFTRKPQLGADGWSL